MYSPPTMFRSMEARLLEALPSGAVDFVQVLCKLRDEAFTVNERSRPRDAA